jgi:hypothetical protein
MALNKKSTKSCGTWHRVIWQKTSNLSEVHTPSIIRIEQLSYTDVTDTTGTYETPVNNYQTTRRHIPQDSISFTFTAAGLPISRVTPNGLQCQEFSTGVLGRILSPKYNSLVTRLYNRGNKGTIPRVPSVVRGWIYYTTDITWKTRGEMTVIFARRHNAKAPGIFFRMPSQFIRFQNYKVR